MNTPADSEIQPAEGNRQAAGLRLDGFARLLIALSLAGVLFTFRYPLLFDPIAARVAGVMQESEQVQSHDLGLARRRIASEETARYIDAQMAGIQSSPDRYELFKRSLSSAKIKGLYCEFGVFRGRSINFIADLVPKQTVHGFDSFEGLPESWRDDFGKGTFAMNGLPPVRKNVVLHKGWFDKTVPAFKESTSEPIAFAHLDADLYSSTVTVLEGLADRIVPGTVLQFDEFFNYPGWQNGEFRAFSEFAARHSVKFSFVGYSDQQVALMITGH